MPTSKQPAVKIVTYGMKKMGGTHPAGLDCTIDCRMIQNPGGYAGDAPGTQRVTDWVQDSPAYPGILGSALTQTLYALQKSGAAPKVGVFCAWGVHRSRVVANALAAALKGMGIEAVQEHL